MENKTDRRLAVLIDAENVPRNCIKGVLEEVAKYGTPTIKRIYGDWTNHSLDGWKNSVLESAITPIQQYSYTTGKNSSDSAMIIDAMDILYTGQTGGFVIVSSDSDFTRLAIRLREAGQFVIGIGERKTPQAFITACDKFTYIEVIRANYADARAEAEHPQKSAAAETTAPDAAQGAATQGKQQPKVGGAPKPVPRDSDSGKPKAQKLPSDVVQLIAESISDLTEDDDDAGVFMGELGNLVRRKRPDFDCRNYGFKTLSAMIKSCDRFSIDFRQTSDPSIKHPYVKDCEA